MTPYFILTFWILPVIFAQLIASHKNREGGWVWGLLLGWIGVLVVTLR
jgi:hypothetical protein